MEFSPCSPCGSKTCPCPDRLNANPCKNVIKGKSSSCCIFLVLYILITFQDEENRGKRESFEKDNIVGMEDEGFPVYMQAVKDPSSYDDHIWDDTMPINGDLNPDQ